MPSNPEDNAVRVIISPDRMRADIIIADGPTKNAVDELTIRAILESRGITINEAVNNCIEEAVELAKNEDGEITHPVAFGTPPVHGTPGSFELSEELQEARRLRAASMGRIVEHEEQDEDSRDSAEAISHYRRTTLEIVRAGDVIGVIHPPVEGVDGRDVLGRTVSANEAKAFVPPQSKDITVNQDGKVIANAGGELTIEPDNISISDTIEINGDVDFSIGNVDFPGDVSIVKGVRDKFTVRAERDLRVRDVVEAANIDAKRDIRLELGMTARAKGTIRAGRDVFATYIDHANGTVGRDLYIDRELKNCNLVIGGSLRAPGARLAGGNIVAGGSVEFAIAGVEAGTPTEITIGRFPMLSDKLRAAADTESEIANAIEDITARMEILNNRQNLTGDEIEELTLLNMKSAKNATKREKLLGALKAGLELISKHTTPELSIKRRMFPGVSIHIGLHLIEINKPVTTPITLRLNDAGQPVAETQSGENRPISSFADVTPDETAHDFCAYQEEAREPEKKAA